MEPNPDTIEHFKTLILSTGVWYDEFLDSLATEEGVYLAEPYYCNVDGYAMPVGTRICVAFDESLSQSAIDNIVAQFKAVIDHPVEGMANVFVIRNTDSTGMHLLDLANALYELEETRYSHPEFGVWPESFAYQAYDFYSEYQVHTKRVVGRFNEASVWDFAGATSPTVVAVIDAGVEPHEDLPATRILSGRDFWMWPYDNDPTPGDSAMHGLACAGIIAASNTVDSLERLAASSGLMSMAPNVSILPVKIADDRGSFQYIYESNVASAITYAYTHGADVLSNSWGWTKGGITFDVVNDAIERATLFGRNGRGCPVFFASGNEGTEMGVRYPGNLQSVMAVGATQLNDSVWFFSCSGADLDIVAPSGDGFTSGVWTLDQMG